MRLYLPFQTRMQLRTALLISVLIPMGVVAGLIGWWSLRTFERQVETRMQQDLEMVARAIKQPLRHALRREREGSIAQAMESAFAMSHVYGAYLYDAKGRKISDAADDAEAEAVERDALRPHLDEGRRHGEYGEVGGREVYSYFVPLTDSGGRLTGLLQLTRRYSDFEAQFRRIRYRAVGLFLLSFMGLTGLMLYGHHRAFGTHLSRLFDSMARIAEGEHHHRHAPGGPRELSMLGRHFNRMMDNIDRAEREIRRRRRQQQSLQTRLRQTEKLAAIGELAAGVAHELGTPLSLIDATAQQTLRHDDLNSREQRAFTRIRCETARMERIIRQLLDFSRGGNLEYRRVQVAPLIESVISAVSAEASHHDVDLNVSCAPELRMRIDPERIQQALVNLLQNAIHAAPRGEVWLACSHEGACAIFSVADNGKGIPPRHRTKVFEPFFTTKPVGQGTGLGLAVVHGIAAEHGGRCELDDTRQTGTCFRLVLPIQPPELRDPT